jgi:hypothetical protein
MKPKMTAEQDEVFCKYVKLEGRDKLRQLHAILQADPKFAHITERQLQRWSTKFKWSDAHDTVSAEIMETARAAVVPLIRSMVERQVEGLHKLQDRFLERLALDPNDPNLTDRERARAIDPDFKDFQEAVKLERLILGDPTERREIVNTGSHLVHELGKEQLMEIAREAARRRFGAVVDFNMEDSIDVESVALPAKDNSNE